MTAVRKKIIKKPTQATIEPKEDLSRYTLTTPVENSISEMEKIEPEPSEDEAFGQSKIGKIWIIGFAILILLSLAGGIFIYTQDIIKSAPTPTPTTAATPTSTANPTLTQIPKAIDLSLYKIKVLNGSGIAGEAAKVKSLLEEEKFTVSSVGNADKSDYQKTVIQANKNVPQEFIDKLRTFFETSYDLEDGVGLQETNDIDVVIIISKEKTAPPQ